MTGDDLLDRFGMLPVSNRGVDDQEIGGFGAEKRVQLRRIGRRVEGMCVSQDEAKMSEQVARKECDDVQSAVRRIIGANTRFFVTKCRFTQRTATLAFGMSVHRPVHPLPESSMSRRKISLVVIAIASLVISACGISPTAPRHDDTVTSGSGG
jgi:hypothetical protein